MKKEYKLALIVFILSLIACVFVVAFTLFDELDRKSINNQISDKDLVLEIKDVSGERINLTSAEPITDSEGLNTTGYTLILKNMSNNSVDYRIKLIDDDKFYSSDGCSSNKLDWANIKYAINNNESSPAIKILADVDGVIDEGVLAANSTSVFTLKLWIRSGVSDDVLGQHFHSKIRIVKES